jgi:hypothetical protein
MFLLLPDNSLKADTCQDEIKLQKVFSVCNTVFWVCWQSEGNSSLLCFQYNQKYNTVGLNTTIYLSYKINYIFQPIYIHYQADYKTRTVYTELPATGAWLTMQPLNSELCHIHYMSTETEQQNIPIRIRCSQWRVRDTTMWLSNTSAASSTITANRITEHTNRDQMFAVASQRHDNVALHRTQVPTKLSLHAHTHARARARTHTHTHTHTHRVLLLIPVTRRCNI